MSEVIVITSGKGGVGKTTTTANVGTGLAKEGKKVVLIDTDIGLRNLDVVMGLENRIVYNLVDVVEGNCRIKQAMIKDKKYDWISNEISVHCVYNVFCKVYSNTIIRFPLWFRFFVKDWEICFVCIL